MTIQASARWVGSLCVIAAIMIVMSQGLHLALGLTMGAQSADSVLHTVKYSLALLAMFALLLALTGLYLRQAVAAGNLGLIGYIVASLGTVLVAGDWWFEAFIAPGIAAVAPQVMTGAVTSSMVVGAVATFGLFAVGWTIFGIASFRANIYPRPAVGLLVLGGAVGILALSTPYQVPLALAVGWIGYSLIRSEPAVMLTPAATPA